MSINTCLKLINIKLLSVLFLFFLYNLSINCSAIYYNFEDGDPPEIKGDWSPDYTRYKSGICSMKSKDIERTNISSMCMGIEGPATISFWWSLYNSCDNGKLNFFVDDGPEGRKYNPNNPNESYPICDNQTHIISWCYERTKYQPSSGSAWVDDICITKCDINFVLYPENHSFMDRFIDIKVNTNFEVYNISLELIVPNDIDLLDVSTAGFFEGVNWMRDGNLVTISQTNAIGCRSGNIKFKTNVTTDNGIYDVFVRNIEIRGVVEKCNPKVKHYWRISKGIDGYISANSMELL